MAILTTCVNSATGDLLLLTSFGEYLQIGAMTLGFYKIQENCETIQVAVTTINYAEVFHVNKELSLTHIQDEVDSLKDNVAFARTAVDYFYNAI